MNTPLLSRRSSERSDDRLPGTTGMGPVTLAVHQLDPMLRFYREGVGLSLLSASRGTATLGRRGVPLLTLDQDGTLAPAPAGAAGLYHTAFLFESTAQLATVVASVARVAGDRFQGASDHLVSEAFYFADPEGNGVELYVDRPRSEWRILPTGEVEMASLPLDPARYLRTHLPEEPAARVEDEPAQIGHVHLKVGNISAAREFYVDTVGFDVTLEFGRHALFVSAGGYHHHLGMNTWESRGAGERSPSLGLGEVVITAPTTPDGTGSDTLGALRERLASRGVHGELDDTAKGSQLSFYDPWRNRIRVHAA